MMRGGMTRGGGKCIGTTLLRPSCRVTLEAAALFVPFTKAQHHRPTDLVSNQATAGMA